MLSIAWQRLAGTDANIRYYNLPADITYVFQGAPQDTAGLYVVSSPDELAGNKRLLRYKQSGMFAFMQVLVLTQQAIP